MVWSTSAIRYKHSSRCTLFRHNFVNVILGAPSTRFSLIIGHGTQRLDFPDSLLVVFTHSVNAMQLMLYAGLARTDGAICTPSCQAMYCHFVLDSMRVALLNVRHNGCGCAEIVPATADPVHSIRGKHIATYHVLTNPTWFPLSSVLPICCIMCRYCLIV